MKRLVHEIFSLITRIFNVLFLFGEANYTTSARVYLNSRLYGGWWTRFEKIIDLVLGAGHCQSIWSGRVERAKKTLIEDAKIKASEEN